MNIEQPVQMPTEEEVRAIETRLKAFSAEHPEGVELNVSEQEILVAAKLLAGRLVQSGKSAEDIDDDMALRALEARCDVRGSEKMPVLDNQGMVIGTAGSPDEAKKMARLENEARDLG